MVIMVWPEKHPLKDKPLVTVNAIWHLIAPDQRSLCDRFEVLISLDKHFLPQGAIPCTSCVNELLRRVDLNLIGVPNAP